MHCRGRHPSPQRRYRPCVRFPWANTALLVLVAVQVASGLAGLLGSTDPFRIAFWAHAVGGYAIIAVLLAKVLIVRDATRRRPALTDSRLLLFLMLGLLVATLATGLTWIVAGPLSVGGVSLINLHAYLALLLAGLLVWHVVDRRWIWRVPRSADRAAFLRIGALSVAGLALWQAERWTQVLLGTPGSRRRFTGSYETGSLTGDFPQTIWLNDTLPQIDAGAWRLRVEGAVERPQALALGELRALSGRPQEALIDCTGGWFSRQVWAGPRVGRLLDLAGLAPEANSVEVRSATGYARRFDIADARELVLATAVAGRPLTPGHGAPARLVVPWGRGFEWVKWVVEIRVLGSSHLLQPPLPLS